MPAISAIWHPSSAVSTTPTEWLTTTTAANPFAIVSLHPHLLLLFAVAFDVFCFALLCFALVVECWSSLCRWLSLGVQSEAAALFLWPQLIRVICVSFFSFCRLTMELPLSSSHNAALKVMRFELAEEEKKMKKLMMNIRKFQICRQV